VPDIAMQLTKLRNVTAPRVLRRGFDPHNVRPEIPMLLLQELKYFIDGTVHQFRSHVWKGSPDMRVYLQTEKSVEVVVVLGKSGGNLESCLNQ
jgi:hypothetical protein